MWLTTMLKRTSVYPPEPRMKDAPPETVVAGPYIPSPDLPAMELALFTRRDGI